MPGREFSISCKLGVRIQCLLKACWWIVVVLFATWLNYRSIPGMRFWGFSLELFKNSIIFRVWKIQPCLVAWSLSLVSHCTVMIVCLLLIWWRVNLCVSLCLCSSPPGCVTSLFCASHTRLCMCEIGTKLCVVGATLCRGWHQIVSVAIRLSQLASDCCS